MPPLDDNQVLTLRAAMDRIVPADDFPSASDAGCLDFLLKLIELEQLEEPYRDGLNGLEIEARLLGYTFSDLKEKDQDALILRLEKEKENPSWGISPAEFVALLARQTIEGYYADPGNGGNRDQVAWHMVGYEVRG